MSLVCDCSAKLNYQPFPPKEGALQGQAVTESRGCEGRKEVARQTIQSESIAIRRGECTSTPHKDMDITGACCSVVVIVVFIVVVESVQPGERLACGYHM